MSAMTGPSPKAQQCECNARALVGPGAMWVVSPAENAAHAVLTGNPCVILMHRGELGDGGKFSDVWNASHKRIFAIPRTKVFTIDTSVHPSFGDDFVAHLYEDARADDQARMENMRHMMTPVEFPCTVVFSPGNNAVVVPRRRHVVDSTTLVNAIMAAIGETAPEKDPETEKQPPPAQPRPHSHPRPPAPEAHLHKAAHAVAQGMPGITVVFVIHAAWCQYCQRLMKETWTEEYQNEIRDRGVFVINCAVSSPGGQDAERLISMLLPQITEEHVEVPQTIPCVVMVRYNNDVPSVNIFTGYQGEEWWKSHFEEGLAKIMA